MLSKEDNEALTRVGPGTLMGNLFRRFWLPAVLTKEIEQPDCPPVRLRILGEDLLAFRDTQGRVGIVEAYCSHRRAPLYMGRNEDCGLRCAYHGWKFDVDGKCVDLPNINTTRDITMIRQRMSIVAYPTREVNGVVWVYMGPADKMPEMPVFEWMSLPADQVHVSRWLQRSNYMQGVEGEIDTSHISFLHKDFDRDHSALKERGADLAAVDGAPELTLRENEQGFTYGARRVVQGKQFWRVTQWMAPMYSLIPTSLGTTFTTGGGRAWVPVDDDNVTTFSFGFRADRPFNEQELAVFDEGKLFPPRMKAGSIQLQQGHKIDTFLPLANKENEFLLDREMQRTVNFTGIVGANEQDRSLQEWMPADRPGGGVVDRSKEHLVASDIAIVTARRQLLKLARDLAQGIEPVAAQQGSLYAVRAISRTCDHADYDSFLQEYGDDLFVPGATEPATQ